MTHLVYNSAHVVVDPALGGHTAQHRKGPRVGVKQHFMRLGEVSHQDASPAGSQFGVRHFQTPSKSGNNDVFAAPIKLEGLAKLKAKQHKPGVTGGFFPFPLPVPAAEVDQILAAAKSHSAYGHEIDSRLYGARNCRSGYQP